MKTASNILHSYRFSLILLFSIVTGACLGLIFKEQSVLFKPFGDIFLNLLFMIVVPVVFFSISSSIAVMQDLRRLGKILGWMMVIFIATGIVSSVLMMALVQVFPPAQGISITVAQGFEFEAFNLQEKLVSTFTVNDFSLLFSKKNMIALIVFSMLIGLAASSKGVKAEAFVKFLTAGHEVMVKAVEFIMFYAPIGLGAYFAYIVGVFGPQLMGSYFRAMCIYYPAAFFYFFAAYTLYVWWAVGPKAVKPFWAKIFPVSLTALATGSSVATIPANLEAAREMGTPQEIREVVIPIGATIHMEGSCLAAILKIAFLFGLFNVPFNDPLVMLTAIGVALLSGTVMSGIPGGGFLGELLIVTLYGFPIEALPIIAMIGTLVDPPATMVNATGDNVSSLMIAKITSGGKWKYNENVG